MQRSRQVAPAEAALRGVVEVASAAAVEAAWTWTRRRIRGPGSSDDPTLQLDVQRERTQCSE